MTTDLAPLVEACLRAPSAEAVTRLRSAVLSSPGYDPLVTVEALVAEQESTQVLAAIQAKMPGLLLSPRAHAHLARAHAALGDEDAAAVESLLAHLAETAILTSGDGSEQRPYAVMRVEDEYAVLPARPLSHATWHAQDGSAAFDVLTLADGTQLWFNLLWRRSPAHAEPDRPGT